MVLSINIRDIDPLMASQVLESITPLLKNSESLTFSYKKECDEDWNEKNYETALALLLHNELKCAREAYRPYPLCLERTDIYG